MNDIQRLKPVFKFNKNSSYVVNMLNESGFKVTSGLTYMWFVFKKVLAMSKLKSFFLW